MHKIAVYGQGILRTFLPLPTLVYVHWEIIRGEQGITKLMIMNNESICLGRLGYVSLVLHKFCAAVSNANSVSADVAAPSLTTLGGSPYNQLTRI